MNQDAPQRMVTIEDVHKIIGALTLELDMVKRENASLRETLQKLQPYTPSNEAPRPAMVKG